MPSNFRLENELQKFEYSSNIVDSFTAEMCSAVLGAHIKVFKTQLWKELLQGVNMHRQKILLQTLSKTLNLRR